MNNLDKQYTDLLQDILDNGIQKSDRTGTGTISVFGRQIRHKMSEGFPLLTTKKMAWNSIVTELLWFLKGDTNIKFLVDKGCNVWNGDAYKNYDKFIKYSAWRHENRLNLNWFTRDHESDVHMMSGPAYRPLNQQEFINKIKTDDEFANKWGELGPIYGKQWRKWTLPKFDHWGKDINNWNKDIDQIANLINELKTNPDSRRLMVNAWNVGEIENMVLPPCHYGFQVYTRELSTREMCELAGVDYNEATKWTYHGKNIDRDLEVRTMLSDKDVKNIPTRAISLMWNQRSVDTFLGLPFNIASYGLLLEIIAKVVNMVPDELIGNLGDVHLYSNHIEQAKEQIGRVYTADERSEMLKEEMGYEKYHKAVEDLMPFGGGLSEYYVSNKIPYHTKEPFKLPTLKFSDWYVNANKEKHSDTVFNDWIVSLKSTDFTLENYQSHPSIKAPLSN